jgi:hypothetical protein
MSCVKLAASPTCSTHRSRNTRCWWRRLLLRDAVHWCWCGCGGHLLHSFSHEGSSRIRSQALNNCYTPWELHQEDGNLNRERGRRGRVAKLKVELELSGNMKRQWTPRRSKREARRRLTQQHHGHQQAGPQFPSHPACFLCSCSLAQFPAWPVHGVQNQPERWLGRLKGRIWTPWTRA